MNVVNDAAAESASLAVASVEQPLQNHVLIIVDEG
jgi:hypothetical protein